MTNEEFENLVRKLEIQAQENPQAYQRKVLLLAIVGNAYVFAMLILLSLSVLALAALIVYLKALAIKLILIVGAFVYSIARALWINVEPPEGDEITAEQAPRLFAMINELRNKLGAPHFHHVLITEQFNAGVIQSPRLGFFGWTRNYLLVGLPLIKTLSEDQFKAVLAHEFGHLAKGHGRVSNWIYRQRLRWNRLLSLLEQQNSRGSFLFKPFLKWFSPRFNAYSFPLARANEYEADATSIRLCSRQATAEALTSVNVIGDFLTERFWPAIHKRAEEQPSPNFAPYQAITHSLSADLDQQSAADLLERTLARETDLADTHPALRDRLKAIGSTAHLALPTAANCADQLLGSALSTLTASFDNRWQQLIQPSWAERYQKIQTGRREFAELNTKLAQGIELSEQEAYDRALLTESIGKNAEAALELLRRFHAQYPDNELAAFGLGTRLLANNDAEGSRLIEAVMARNEHAAAVGCEVLRDWHWRNGRKEEAQSWHQRLLNRSETAAAAQKEREHVFINDIFLQHNLSEPVIAKLQAQLQEIKSIRKAYLVKKAVVHLAHVPCYLLAYSVTGWFQLHSKNRAQQALQAIQQSAEFPGETLIINIDGENRRFARKLRWKRGFRII